MQNDIDGSEFFIYLFIIEISSEKASLTDELDDFSMMKNNNHTIWHILRSPPTLFRVYMCH